MKTLSRLTGQEITFQLPDGQSVRVKPLAVRFFDEYLATLRTAEENPTSRTIAAGRIALRNLIRHVWPEKYAKHLFCFDYVGLCHLTRILFFGEKAAEQKQSVSLTRKGKTGKLREVDLLIMAGRILHTFPSFTLEELLDLPLMVFFELDSLVYRIQADAALQIFIPAIGAGMGTEESIQILRKIRAGGETYPETSNTYTYSEEDLQKAISKLSAPQTEVTTIRVGRILLD